MQTSFTASGIISFGSTSMQKAPQENKKQKRRFWVRKVFTEERKERGEWENLFRKLSKDDQECYYRYLRMSPEGAIVSANNKLN